MGAELSGGIIIVLTVIFGFPGTDILSSKWEQREYEKELEKLEWMEYQKDKGYKKSINPDEEDQLYLDDIELRELERLKKRNWDDRDFV